MITEQTRHRLDRPGSFEFLNAVQEIGAEAPDTEVLDLLLPYLADSNVQVRDTVVDALAPWSAHPAVRNILATQLMCCTPALLGLVRALQPQVGDPVVRTMLLKLLADPGTDPASRAAISLALVPYTADPEVLDRLIALLRRAGTPVFQAVVATLANQRANPLVRDALLDRVTDPDRFVRQTAVQAIRLWIRDPAVRAALWPLCDDWDLGVRQMATAFLGAC